MDDTGEKPCKIPSFRAAKDANLLRAEQALRCCDIIRGAVLDIATILTIHSLLSTCSIRETARLEGRAASTVSAALERMESALAIPLLRREGTVLSLTLEAQKPLPATLPFDRPFAFPHLSDLWPPQKLEAYVPPQKSWTWVSRN
jgi:hypothetical protein